jgi:WD40 repeat protein
MTFSPDGGAIADVAPLSLSFYDAHTGKKRASLLLEGGGHVGPPFAIAYSSDGKLIAVGTPSALLIVDAEHYRIKETLSAGASARTAAFSPDGSLLAADGESGDILVWDTTTGKRRYTLIGHQDQIVSIAFAPRGNQLASTSADSVLALMKSLSELIFWRPLDYARSYGV